MQQLHSVTVTRASAGDCGAEILETVPVVTGFIRFHMRRHRGSDLSVQQFRTLAFIDRNPEASLSLVANYLGLSKPTTSRLVEGLVRKSLVTREIRQGNRRQVALTVRSRGRMAVVTARQATIRRLAEVVAPLGGDERASIRRALRVLRREFQSAAARDGLGMGHS